MEPRWAPAALAAWLPALDAGEASLPEQVQIAPELAGASRAPAEPPATNTSGSPAPPPISPDSEQLPGVGDEAAADELGRDEQAQPPAWLDLSEISDEIATQNTPTKAGNDDRQAARDEPLADPAAARTGGPAVAFPQRPGDVPVAESAAGPVGGAKLPWSGSGARPRPAVDAASWLGGDQADGERGRWRAVEPVRYPLRIPAGNTAAAQPELLDLEWSPAGPPLGTSLAAPQATANAATEQSPPRLQPASQPLSSSRPQPPANTARPPRRVFGEHSGQPLMLIVPPGPERLPRLDRTSRLNTEPLPVPAEPSAAAEPEPVRPHAEAAASFPANEHRQSALGITVLLVIAGERMTQRPPTSRAL